MRTKACCLSVHQPGVSWIRCPFPSGGSHEAAHLLAGETFDPIKCLSREWVVAYVCEHVFMSLWTKAAGTLLRCCLAEVRSGALSSRGREGAENSTIISTPLLLLTRPPQPAAPHIPHPAALDGGLLATSHFAFSCPGCGGQGSRSAEWRVHTLLPALRKVGAETRWRWGMTAGALSPSERGEAPDPESTLLRKLHNGCPPEKLGLFSCEPPGPSDF